MTAETDCELFTLGRDDFVATLTAPRSGEVAAATVAARFAGAE